MCVCTVQYNMETLAWPVLLASQEAHASTAPLLSNLWLQLFVEPVGVSGSPLITEEKHFWSNVSCGVFEPAKHIHCNPIPVESRTGLVSWLVLCPAVVFRTSSNNS